MASQPCGLTSRWHGTGWWPRLTAVVSIECHTTQDHFQLPWSKTYGEAPIWMCPIMQIKYPHTHLPWKTTEMLYVFTFVCFKQTSLMWTAEEGTEMEQFVGHVSLQSSLLWPRRLSLTSSVSVRSSLEQQQWAHKAVLRLTLLSPVWAGIPKIGWHPFLLRLPAHTSGLWEGPGCPLCPVESTSFSLWNTTLLEK